MSSGYFKTEKRESKFYQIACDRGLYSKPLRLKNYCQYFFGEFDFDSKHVLDVGGGKGLLSFYSAAKGAKRVVCLEPSACGSSVDTSELFQKVRRIMPNGSRVKLLTKKIQDYESPGEKYDLVILNNSINHLDEDACITLLSDVGSFDKYVEIFKKLSVMMKKRALLIITDCSNTNFWHSRGLRNPFVPTIEWHKHQNPSTWIKVLNECGFTNPQLDWTSFNVLGSVGRKIFNHKFIAYFLMSHFRLSMIKGKTILNQK